jgi:hypothetical protein
MDIPIIPANFHVREIDMTRDMSPRKLELVPLQYDSAIIGEEGRMVSKLLTQLRQVQKAVQPDLEVLKKRIINGTYNPSSEDIARAILFGPPK